MADKLAREDSAAIICGPKPALPLWGSIAQLMTKKWADNQQQIVDSQSSS
jgi:hypothetical protein